MLYIHLEGYSRKKRNKHLLMYMLSVAYAEANIQQGVSNDSRANQSIA